MITNKTNKNQTTMKYTEPWTTPFYWESPEYEATQDRLPQLLALDYAEQERLENIYQEDMLMESIKYQAETIAMIEACYCPDIALLEDYLWYDECMDAWYETMLSLRY